MRHVYDQYFLLGACLSFPCVFLDFLGVLNPRQTLTHCHVCSEDLDAEHVWYEGGGLFLCLPEENSILLGVPILKFTHFLLD